MNAIDYFESLDSCITDACAFLRIERRDFFALARRWPHYVSQFKTFDKREDFYRAFQDDRGRSNVCANILDQLGRIDLASLLEQLPVSSETVGPLILADIGCGTAAQSFDMARRFGAAYLVDICPISPRNSSPGAAGITPPLMCMSAPWPILPHLCTSCCASMCWNTLPRPALFSSRWTGC